MIVKEDCEFKVMTSCESVHPAGRGYIPFLSSLLLIYINSILHISTKFGMKVYGFMTFM